MQTHERLRPRTPTGRLAYFFPSSRELPQLCCLLLQHVTAWKVLPHAYQTRHDSHTLLHTSRPNSMHRPTLSVLDVPACPQARHLPRWTNDLGQFQDCLEPPACFGRQLLHVSLPSCDNSYSPLHACRFNLEASSLTQRFCSLYVQEDSCPCQVCSNGQLCSSRMGSSPFCPIKGDENNVIGWLRESDKRGERVAILKRRK